MLSQARALRSELTYFHLLDLLTERSAVARSVLAGDADLLRALGHCGCVVEGVWGWGWVVVESAVVVFWKWRAVVFRFLGTSPIFALTLWVSQPENLHSARDYIHSASLENQKESVVSSLWAARCIVWT